MYLLTFLIAKRPFSSLVRNGRPTCLTMSHLMDTYAIAAGTRDTGSSCALQMMTQTLTIGQG